jgi:hypothetical protein
MNDVPEDLVDSILEEAAKKPNAAINTSGERFFEVVGPDGTVAATFELPTFS